MGETRGMSHAALDLAYAKYLGLLARPWGPLRSDSDLQALDALVPAAYQEYRTEFSREDGPGPHYWLHKAAARRVLGVDDLTAILEFKVHIDTMVAAIGAKLDEHTTPE